MKPNLNNFISFSWHQRLTSREFSSVLQVLRAQRTDLFSNYNSIFMKKKFINAEMWQETWCTCVVWLRSLSCTTRVTLCYDSVLVNFCCFTVFAIMFHSSVETLSSSLNSPAMKLYSPPSNCTTCHIIIIIIISSNATVITPSLQSLTGQRVFVHKSFTKMADISHS